MDNYYRTPDAPLVNLKDDITAPFFVTSIRKMCVLYLITMGLYSIYWHYKHWDSQRYSMGKKIYPFLRMAFPILYTYSLCQLISQRLLIQKQTAWPYRGIAAIIVAITYIKASIAIDLLPAIFENWKLLRITLITSMIALLIPMIMVQRKANLASNDPSGNRNSTFSMNNYIIVICGITYWARSIYVTYLLATSPFY